MPCKLIYLVCCIYSLAMNLKMIYSIYTMRIHKDIEEVKFHTTTLGGEELEGSEDIVMASAAGWYVGAICKSPELDGMIEPYDRYTHYVATPEEAERMLED